MSSSDVPAAARLPVSVVASDDAAEVFLVDSEFRVVARGIGRVSASVAPGIYRAKARVGELQNELLFALDEGDTAGRNVPVEAPVFASPVPLARTSTMPGAHEGAAAAMSRTDSRRLVLGAGARLVLVFRDPAVGGAALDDEALGDYTRAWQGLALRDAAGHRSAMVDAGALDARAGWLLVEADVDPGGWVVSVPVPGRPDRCMPLVASAGWSTQLFVNLAPGADPRARGFRLDDAAIVIDRPGAPFVAERHDLRVLEVARQALAGGHNVVSGPVMDELLMGKYENPMMGLVAAHLLLLDASPDLALVGTVIENTARLIGADHPDLIALRLRVDLLRGRPAGGLAAMLEALQQPPMLRLSWTYLMAALASASAGGNAALAARMPFALATCVVGSALWLTWEDLPLPEPAEMASIVPPAATGTSPLRVPPTIDIQRHTQSMRKNGGSGGAGARILAGALELGAAAQQLGARVSQRLGELLGRGQKRPKLRDAAQLAMQFLLERHDWDEIVRLLKQQPDAGALLTPRQRSLLLALRSAQQQWRDDGGLPALESFVDWLTSRNVTWTSVAADVKAVQRLAERLEPPRDADRSRR